MGWLWEGSRWVFCTRPDHVEGDVPMLQRSELREGNAVRLSIEESKVHWSELPAVPTNSDTLAESTYQGKNLASFKELQQLHPFFFQDWSKKVKVGKLIGEGGQAQIYKATWKDRQSRYLPDGIHLPKAMVVKVFKLDGCSVEDFSTHWPRVTSISESVLRDRSGLYSNIGSFVSIQEPDYICPIVGAFVLENKRFAFLMERYKYDLRTLIDIKMRKNASRKPPLSAEGIRVLKWIAEGMEWLHKQGVLHRDLKSSNVLVQNGKYGLECVVSDFECSIGTVGTGFWRAPEVLQELRDRSGRRREDIWTTKSDVYSYGMLCFEVLTGGYPFAEFSSTKDWDKIIDHDQRPLLPDYVDPELQQLVKSCWDRDPSKRPSFREIVLDLEKYVVKNETRTIRRGRGRALLGMLHV